MWIVHVCELFMNMDSSCVWIVHICVWTVHVWEALRATALKDIHYKNKQILYKQAKVKYICDISSFKSFRFKLFNTYINKF
jgi:hypothetical protein